VFLVFTDTIYVMKKLIIGAVLLTVTAVGVYFFLNFPLSIEGDDVNDTGSTEESADTNPYEVIGTSVEGRKIRAFRFGGGEKTLVYVGAIHGGYEWNTALLSYELIDYLTNNGNVVPADIEVIVIPVTNPDGLYKVVGTSDKFAAEEAPQFDFASEVSIDDTVVSGRFNSRGVDLNRNFDCKWQKDALWRNYTVSAGSEPFSEPEAKALRDFLIAESPEAVVFFHSASNGIYTSICEGDVLPETKSLQTAYSEASGYPRPDSFTYYEVTGDAADWLSTIGIPAITVELSQHDVIEWEKNRAGIEAMFHLYSALD